MSPGRELVSVVCADPGAPQHFSEALRSLRAQTGVAWELLLVGEPELAVLAGSDDRVRVVPARATSVAERRNVGLDAARGDVITFLEGGDVLGLASLERRLAVVRPGNAEAAYCRAEFTDADLQPLDVIRSGPAVLTFADAHDEPPLLSSLLGRREAIRRVRFDPDRENAADWLYVAQLLRAGVRIARADDCEILHRPDTDHRKPLDLLEAERQRLAVLDLLYAPDEDAVPECRDGLRVPDRTVVRTRRLAGLIVRVLLTDDVDAVAQAVELAAGDELRPDLDLRGIVETAAAEALACPSAQLRPRLFQRMPRLAAHADGAELFERLPELAVALTRGGLPLVTRQPLIDVTPLAVASRLPAPGDDIVGPFERGEARLREHELVHGLLTLRRPRPGLMIDVGAHAGGTLQLFCEDGWTVRAFEPDPANRAGLERRVKPHWILDIDDRAVSDHSGEIVQFFTTPESSGASSLTAFTDRHTAAATVQTVTLSDALGTGNADGIGHVHFLKTDVEGHDLPALRGFPWSLDRPDVVLCEFEDNKTRHVGYTTNELARFLVDHGYEVFVSEWHPIVRYGIVHDFRRFYRFRPDVPNTAWGNLIAVGSPAAAADLVGLARTGVGLDRSPVVAKAVGAKEQARSEDRPGSATDVSVRTGRHRAVDAIASIARWYASPSGVLLAVALALLAISIIGVGPSQLFGLLGVAALAVFVPWKLSAMHRRASSRLDVVSRQLAAISHDTATVSTRVAAVDSRQRSADEAISADLRALRLSTAASIARRPTLDDPARAEDPP